MSDGLEVFNVLARATSILDSCIAIAGVVLVLQIIVDFVEASDLHVSDDGDVVFGYADKKADFDATAWKRKRLRDAQTNRRWDEEQADKYERRADAREWGDEE